MTTNGDPVDILIYATCKQPEEVWKKSLLLNEVSDWLSGTPWKGGNCICEQPRRYIGIKGNDKRHQTTILSRFVQGKFTCSSLMEEEEKKWEKEEDGPTAQKMC
ncbi:hypothetical protein DPV78_002154 [Talaromyces pinophilus]|nr:hypothetical protein DPV78_002154 [Talaromyces pinophilus]